MSAWAWSCEPQQHQQKTPPDELPATAKEETSSSVGGASQRE